MHSTDHDREDVRFRDVDVDLAEDEILAAGLDEDRESVEAGFASGRAELASLATPTNAVHRM